MTHQLVAPGFVGVAERFRRLAAERAGWSGALAAYVGGEPVLDVWAGPAYDGTQIQCVYSCTKGIGATCCALLVERGLLDPDAPVATYWPEFAAAGKEAVTVRQMLAHQAGLIAVDGGYTLEEYLAHDGLAARLAAQRPHWEPGTRHGYHSLLFGTLVRELVHRVTGCGTRSLYDQEIRVPYAIDWTIGCPVEQRHRIGEHHFPTGPPDVPPEIAARMAANPLAPLVLARPFPLFETQYRSDAMEGDLPAVNGFASARGLARFYAALTTGVDGLGPVLAPETIALVSKEVASGPDAVLPADMAFGLGYMVPMARIPMAGPGSFGHDGAAGALGIANPRHGLAFGFVSDSVVSQGADPAASDLAQAVVDAIR